MFIELDERIWLHFFHNQQSSKTLSMIVNRSPKSGMGKKISLLVHLILQSIGIFSEARNQIK